MEGGPTHKAKVPKQTSRRPLIRFFFIWFIFICQFNQCNTTIAYGLTLGEALLSLQCHQQVVVAFYRADVWEVRLSHPWQSILALDRLVNAYEPTLFIINWRFYVHSPVSNLETPRMACSSTLLYFSDVLGPVWLCVSRNIPFFTLSICVYDLCARTSRLFSLFVPIMFSK